MVIVIHTDLLFKDRRKLIFRIYMPSICNFLILTIDLDQRCATMTLFFKVREADRGECCHRNILVPTFL